MNTGLCIYTIVRKLLFFVRNEQYLCFTRGLSSDSRIFRHYTWIIMDYRGWDPPMAFGLHTLRIYLIEIWWTITDLDVFWILLDFDASWTRHFRAFTQYRNEGDPICFRDERGLWTRILITMETEELSAASKRVPKMTVKHKRNGLISWWGLEKPSWDI